MAIVYGSKSQVYHGSADETRGGLLKKDIIRLDDGYGNIRYKSKKQQKSGRSKNSFRAKWAKAMKKARKELEKEGVSCEIIDLRTIRPIDYDTVINSVKKTNRLVIVEEAWPLGSIATEVTFKVQKDAFDYLDAPILRVTSADVPLPYAPTLIEAALPNPTKIIAAVKQVMYSVR